MKRQCNLDLGLAMPLPPPATEEEYSAAVRTSNYNSSIQLKQDDIVHIQKEEEELGGQQLLTIFYEGRVCVCDVTELQAEAILRQARKETELRRSDLTPLSSSSSSSLCRNMDKALSQNLIKTQPHSATVQFSNTSPTSISSTSSSSTSGVRALKRSLERFLEKRKNRIAAASPY